MAVFFHLGAAIFSVGHHHADEHYQTFEFIGPKISEVDHQYLPWEFHEKMRSWFLPFMIFLTQKATNLNMLDLQSLWRFIASFSALFALLYFIYQQNLTHRQNKISLALMALFFWFLPYVHARASGENLGTTFLILALPLLEKLKQKPIKLSPLAITAGVLVALSVQLRFQIGFIIISWLIFNFKYRKHFWPFAVISLLTTLLCSLIDYWGYQQTWAFPPYNYFYQNIILDRASGFGVMPWYGYFELIVQQLTSPIGVIICASLVIFWITRPKHSVTALSFPFFLIHSLVPHKELRFLIPLIPFALLAVTFISDDIYSKIKNYFKLPIHTGLAALALFCLALSVRASFFAANESFLFLEKWSASNLTSPRYPILTYGWDDPFFPYGLTSYALFAPPKPETIKMHTYEAFINYLNKHSERLKTEGIYIYSAEQSFVNFVTRHHPQCKPELQSGPKLSPIWRRPVHILLKCKG